MKEQICTHKQLTLKHRLTTLLYTWKYTDNLDWLLRLNFIAFQQIIALKHKAVKRASKWQFRKRHEHFLQFVCSRGQINNLLHFQRESELWMKSKIEMLQASQARKLTAAECASRVRSDLETGTAKLQTKTEKKWFLGLRERDIDERRNLYGDNELKPPEPTPLYMRYLAQFKVRVKN